VTTTLCRQIGQSYDWSCRGDRPVDHWWAGRTSCAGHKAKGLDFTMSLDDDDNEVWRHHHVRQKKRARLYAWTAYSLPCYSFGSPSCLQLGLAGVASRVHDDPHQNGATTHMDRRGRAPLFDCLMTQILSLRHNTVPYEDFDRDPRIMSTSAVTARQGLTKSGELSQAN
jgi:hypothetical protein